MKRIALCVLALGLTLAPNRALADRWTPDAADSYIWAATASPNVSLRAAATAYADRLALLRAGTRVRVLENDGAWARVFEPRHGATGYIHSDLLAPSEPPTWLAYASPPPVDNDLSTIAIAATDVPLRYVPTLDERAIAIIDQASTRENVIGTVAAEDGTDWLITDDGYYMAADNVFLASAPHVFGGRWLDVSLTGSAHVVAYEGNTAVRSFYAIKGTARWPTPMGAWSIVRRVFNETMDSRTIGIPVNGPGGYLLKNVLYTQYFLGTGESLHYNWWSSAWGAPGSHGCLGLSIGDALWLWNWANIGTPVLIHA